MSTEYFNPTGPVANGAPGWLARGLIYLLLVILASLVVWSAVSRVDVTAAGTATVIPDGRTRAVQSPVAGLVESVRVLEGESVTRGQVLAVVNAEDIHRQRELLDTARRELADVDAEIGGTLPIRSAQAETTRSTNAAEIENITRRIAILRQQLAGLEQEQKLRLESDRLAAQRFETEKRKLAIDRRNAELTRELRWSELRTRQNLKATTVSQEEITRYEKEAEKSDNELERLSAELAQLDTDRDLRATEARIAAEQMGRSQRETRDRILQLENDAARLGQATTDSDAALAEYRAGLNRRKTAAGSEVAAAEKRLAEMLGGAAPGERSDVFEVRAPVDGIVAQADIRHPGQVVEAGSRLFNLVPRGIRLVTEIAVSGSGAGTISESQPVKYHFEAFPAARFGVLTGRVEKVLPQVERSAEGQGTVLRVIAELDQNYFADGGSRYPLRPGLTARAEIITERRSVLSLLFQPLKELTGPEVAGTGTLHDVADN